MTGRRRPFTPVCPACTHTRQPNNVLMPIFCQFFVSFLSSQFCIHVYNTHASWTISSHSVLWIYRRFALLSKLRGQQPFNTMNGEKRTLGVKSVLF